jgi:hypothetical protein
MQITIDKVQKSRSRSVPEVIEHAHPYLLYNSIAMIEIETMQIYKS